MRLLLLQNAAKIKNARKPEGRRRGLEVERFRHAGDGFPNRSPNACAVHVQVAPVKQQLPHEQRQGGANARCFQQLYSNSRRGWFADGSTQADTHTAGNEQPLDATSAALECGSITQNPREPSGEKNYETGRNNINFSGAAHISAAEVRPS